MRQAICFILSLMIFASSAFASAPACATAHQVPAMGRQFTIVRNSEKQISDLKITPFEFASGPKGLTQLISMAAQRPNIKLDPKILEKKNEITLGLLLGENFTHSLELVYEGDARSGEKKLVIQKIVMVLPQVGRKDITKQVLNSETMELLNDGVFELKDLFPPGYRIEAQIPLVVEQTLVDQLQSFFPRIENFETPELRKLTEKGDMRQLKWAAHYRAFRELLKEILTKMSIKKTIEYGVLIFALNHLSGSQIPVKQEPPIIHPNSYQWVTDLNLSLGMTIGKEAKQEILSLNQEIQNQFANKVSDVGINFNQPRIQLGTNDFVWLLEKKDTKKTYLAFSRDTKNGSMEYMILEIDPQLYPKTIAALKAAKMQMNVE